MAKKSTENEDVEHDGEKSSGEESWEMMIGQLEALSKELDRDDLSLSESMVKFEKGVKLYNKCKRVLGEAEKKITFLTEGLKEEEL
jgi:exodeoxyribonuclease VII small subunit